MDGRTWQSYKQNLEVNLAELHSRIHRGTYRALPSRRRYIPKPDGRQRPLGIAALEDKIVQRAVVEMLNTIYEEDFLGFSFRPGSGSARCAGRPGRRDYPHEGELDSGRRHRGILRCSQSRVADALCRTPHR